MADPIPPERKPMTGRRHGYPTLFVLGSTIVWIIILALALKTSVDRLSPPSWGNSIGRSQPVEVAGEAQVGQRFTAPFPGLHRIEVALDRATASGAERVTFTLKTDPSATETLWTADLSTSDVQDSMPVAFELPPIRNSQGQSYYFYLESPDSQPGAAITARYTQDAVLDGASAYLNGQPVAGNLQFHTLYTLRTRDKIDLLLLRMSEGRPYLFGTKAFYVGLAVAYLLVLVAFLWQTAQAVLEEEGS